MRLPTAVAPPVFNYSLDWRFLLPMTDFQNGRILFDDNADFTQTLGQVGIHPRQQLSLQELRTLKNNQFPFFVLPFGLPVSWSGTKSKDRIEFYASLRRFLAAGGYLLVGFNNSLARRTNSQKVYHSSTPRHMVAEMRQAGFKSVKIFGAMPNLQIPEYIFDLDPQTTQFALQNRFRRKPAVLQALRVLSVTIGMQRLSNFLPCYFVVASA